METIRANRNNLASIIMGKNIQFPWRGQKDVIIRIPFDEWLIFVKENRNILKDRPVLNYDKMLESSEETQIRYFMYEVSWALYSELACSSNIQKDSTLILPYFDNGKYMLIEDVLREINTFDDETLSKLDSKLRTVTKNYYNLIEGSDYSYGLVDVSNLSTWNMFIHKMCLYLQSKANNKQQAERLNIDWRIS